MKTLSARKFILGEGPVWDGRSRTISWVDITAGSLFRVKYGENDEPGELDEYQTGQYLGAALPTESGRYVAAMTTGIYLLGDDGMRLLYRPPELTANMRLNDAKCDPAGRLWFGSLALSSRRAGEKGSLFRLTLDSATGDGGSAVKCDEVLTGLTIANGLDWSPDCKTMYFIDTPTEGVDAFDYSVETGEISNRRRAVNLPGKKPDGMTVDAEGMLWVALWGSGAVVRCDPATGRVLSQIDVPATKTSCCCFGGGALDTLFITSSGEGLQGADEGCVFTVKPGPRGKAGFYFKDGIAAREEIRHFCR